MNESILFLKSQPWHWKDTGLYKDQLKKSTIIDWSELVSPWDYFFDFQFEVFQYKFSKKIAQKVPYLSQLFTTDWLWIEVSQILNVEAKRVEDG